MIDRLWAGMARVTITPPVGIPLAGFAGRDRSHDVHDDLTATALVFTSNDNATASLAIIGCDLLGIDASLTRTIQHRVTRLTGMATDHVLICASHTHYGPAGTLNAAVDLTQRSSAVDDQGSMVQAYVDNLVNLVVGVVVAAHRRQQPCWIGYGEAETHIGVNRRERRPDGTIVLGQNPDGACDRRVAVLRIDTPDGQPIGALVNTACHGVSLGSHCTDISADFPGAARTLAERETGGLYLFLQGAAGNINPTRIGWDWTNPLRLGTTLATAVLDAYWSTTPEGGPDTSPIAALATRLELPPWLPASVAAAHAEITTLEARARELASATDPGPLLWVQVRIAQLRRGLDHLHGRAEIPALPADVVAVRLGGEIGIVTAPAEPFSELGLAVVGKSPFPHTLYAGYTNGMVGYLPTADAYSEGGYEVTRACHVAPEAAGLLQQEQLRLLHQLTETSIQH